MENPNLNVRLLDTAIKTMERNRTLLFTINLIAALILVVVYLENYSFDNHQREAHLIAFQERCETLNELLEKVSNFDEGKRAEFSGCSKLDDITAFVAANIGLPLFRVGDFKDPVSLTTKLRDARDPLSQYLRSKFSTDTQRQLEKYNTSSPLAESLRNALVNEFNHLLQDPELFDNQRFTQAQVKLTEETHRLIEQKPIGKHLLRLNRLLLEEAYPYEIEKNTNSSLLEDISKSIFRLHVIKNEMETTKLDTANVAPLVFGLPVPRNDLVVICGVLLVILYVWLSFSFAQHARITEKIKLLFQDSELEEGNKTEATINDLIELNFLFRTSKGRLTALFVRALYLSAPFAMSIATYNDFHPDALKFYRRYIDQRSLVPHRLEIAIMLILWVVGIRIILSDRRANVEPKEQTKSGEAMDPATKET